MEKQNEINITKDLNNNELNENPKKIDPELIQEFCEYLNNNSSHDIMTNNNKEFILQKEQFYQSFILFQQFYFWNMQKKFQKKEKKQTLTPNSIKINDKNLLENNYNIKSEDCYIKEKQIRTLKNHEDTPIKVSNKNFMDLLESKSLMKLLVKLKLKKMAI